MLLFVRRAAVFPVARGRHGMRGVYTKRGSSSRFACVRLEPRISHYDNLWPSRHLSALKHSPPPAGYSRNGRNRRPNNRNQLCPRPAAEADEPRYTFAPTDSPSPARPKPRDCSRVPPSWPCLGMVQYIASGLFLLFFHEPNNAHGRQTSIFPIKRRSAADKDINLEQYFIYADLHLVH